jgi:16S rRNA (adenine1518-N6/adenine1519-N6)-dimethyltransferase
MTTGDGLPPLREVIARHGLSSRKSLGQNFLLDLNLTRRIVREAGLLPGTAVIEVGPGPGGLTRALLAEGVTEVIAIEKDERCLPALEEIATHYPGRLRIILGDATAVDPGAHVSGPAAVVANLPYNVATVLLTGWLTTPSWPPWWQSLTLMFQREVAERIVARPGGEAYGRLGVLAGWRSEARIVMRIPARAFTPPPKVDSAVVRLTPRPHPFPVRARSLERVTAAAFGQRRKMLRTSLRQLLPDPSPLLATAAIAPELRAEQLSIEDFCRLTAAWEKLQAG